MSDKVALIDMDGTLCDYEGRMRRDLEQLQGPDEPPLPADLYDLPPHLEARAFLIKSSPDWWLNLPKIESGFFIVALCRKIGFRINVVTKGPWKTTSAWTQKVQWIQRHASRELAQVDDISIVTNKGRHYGRVLFDDWGPYVQSWLEHRPRGLVVMPQTSYNRDIHHPNIVHWTGDNQDEVADRLLHAYEREDGEAWTGDNQDEVADHDREREDGEA